MSSDERASLAQTYNSRRGNYDEALRKLELLIGELTDPRRKAIQSLSGRVKERESFLDKAERPADDGSSNLKYTSPFEQITDIVGFRIVTYFSDDAVAIADVVCGHFKVVERINKGDQLGYDRFGYQSIHALLRITAERSALVEWSKFHDLTFELQVRTLLQHAWAEIEHDIRYKTDVEARPAVRRRFAQLAGLLEIADREFVSIREEDERLRADAARLRKAGRSDEIVLDGASLRQFFDEQKTELSRTEARDYNHAAEALNAVGVRSVAALVEFWQRANAPEIINYLLADTRLTPLNIVVALIAKERAATPFREHTFADIQDARMYWAWVTRELENWENGKPRSQTYQAFTETWKE